MAGGDELCENSNPLLGFAFDGRPWWNGDLCTQRRIENWCWQDCERMRILGPNLATCFLACYMGWKCPNVWGQ